MNFDIIIQECTFKAVRSSGAGGQHVNKVSSKIEITFPLLTSAGLSDQEKNILLQKIKSKLTKDGALLLQCSESRSQHKNKDLAIKRLYTLLKTGLVIPKKRLETKVPKSVIRKRLKNKQYNSEKKNNRRKPPIDL
ncbi:MAG: alternative ribosome rescue aminoacyl-tRNA hydrolase ArfB [Flavobacteriaceae bacterium]